jgi:hypothetical protein
MGCKGVVGVDFSGRQRRTAEAQRTQRKPSTGAKALEKREGFFTGLKARASTEEPRRTDDGVGPRILVAL